MSVPACFVATDPGVDRILDLVAPSLPDPPAPPKRSDRFILDAPPFRPVKLGSGRSATTVLSRHRERFLEGCATALSNRIGAEVAPSRMLRVAIFCFVEYINSLDSDDPARGWRSVSDAPGHCGSTSTMMSAAEYNIAKYFADERQQGMFSFARDAVVSLESQRADIFLWVRTCRIMWAMRIREERLIQEVLRKARGPMREDEIVAAVLAMPKDYGWPVEHG